MSNQKDVISAIATANSGSFTTVKQSAVAQKDIVDTLIPMLLISNVNSTYKNRLHRTFIEVYEIGLMIVLKESQTPLDDLIAKQRAVVQNLFNSAELNGIILKDSLELKDSSISNVVKVYQNGAKSISCILNVVCEVGVDY